MTPEELATLKLRPAIRALVVDPDDRTLLVRFVFGEVTVWAPPGGGIEPGEDPMVALRRELAEEIGLLDVEIGPHLWTRTHVTPMGQWDGQRDTAHLVRSGFHEPEPQMGWEQLRAENVHELRWWTLDELLATPNTDTFRFAPLELPQLVQAILQDGPPPTPTTLLNRLS